MCADSIEKLMLKSNNQECEFFAIISIYREKLLDHLLIEGSIFANYSNLNAWTKDVRRWTIWFRGLLRIVTMWYLLERLMVKLGKKAANFKHMKLEICRILHMLCIFNKLLPCKIELNEKHLFLHCEQPVAYLRVEWGVWIPHFFLLWFLRFVQKP